MLHSVWTISLALSAVSLLIMALLVLRRLFLEWSVSREKEQRRLLRAALIRFGAEEDAEKLKAEIAEIPLRILAEAGFEYLELVRGQERESILSVFSDLDVPPLLRHHMKKGNRATRVHAAERLSSFPGQETVAALLDALNDRARQVRIAAAISLGKLGELPPLRQLLARIGYRGQRSRRMIEVFQQVGAERAGELREVAVDIRTDPFVRAFAVTAIGQAGDYQYIPFLDEVSRSESPEIAAAAVNALGRLAHPSAEAAILAALDSPDWQVRSEAAQAVADVGLTSAVDKLEQMLADEEWTVRYWSAAALRSLGKDGLKRLRVLAAGPSSRSQRTASMALAEEAA